MAEVRPEYPMANPRKELLTLLDTASPEIVEALLLAAQKLPAADLGKVTAVVDGAVATTDASGALDAAKVEIEKRPKKPTDAKEEAAVKAGR